MTAKDQLIKEIERLKKEINKECKHEWVQLIGNFTVRDDDLNDVPAVVLFCKYCSVMMMRNIKKCFGGEESPT